MGLFGSKKTYVASSVYNMAGDYSERTDYLKHITLNGVLAKTSKSVADTVVSGTLNGPRMNYRAFYRWASQNYPEGMPKSGLEVISGISAEEIAPYVPVSSGKTAGIEEFYFGSPDYLVWVEKWLLENNPIALIEDYEADIDDITKIVTIYYPDDTIDTFLPMDFDPIKKYLYVRFRELGAPISTDPAFVSTEGLQGPYASETSLPDLSNHNLISSVSVSVPYDVYRTTQTTVTYSDGRPDEESEVIDLTGSSSFDRNVKTYRRYLDLYPNPVNTDELLRRISQIITWENPSIQDLEISETVTTEEISPGVMKTTTIRMLESGLSTTEWHYEKQEWKLEQGSAGTLQIWIYQIGSGIPELDALYPVMTDKTGYFPTIPLRIDNRMIDEEPYADTLFDKVKLAYKRASSGGKIQKLLDELYDNEDLDDIDYAFIVWGVPLNSRTRESKLYLYHFFRDMLSQFTNLHGDFNHYLEAAQEWEEYNTAYTAYLNSDGNTTMPIQPPLFSLPSVMVNTVGESEYSKHYNFSLSISGGTEEEFVGQWQVGAKLNDVSVQSAGSITVPKIIRQSGGDTETYTISEQVPALEILWQNTETTFRKLVIYGAVHKNLVYNNKYVTIDSAEALDDADDSGFVVPLHFELLKRMPILWANQLCLECMILVFNCYKIVKKKWYQTFLGLIIVGLVTMGIGAVFSGTGSILAGGGIVGSNVAVGAMFGMTGLAGAIAGAVVNSIAMTILLNIVGTITQNLGPLGILVGAVFNTAMANFSGGFLTGEFNLNLDVFLRTENILALTNAAITAVNAYINMKTQSLSEEALEMENEYKKQQKEIKDKMYELTGISSNFDPMVLTDILNNSSESPKSFHERTLMSGTDIVEFAHSMISDYTAYMLDTSL